jgi:hypothetical protein
MNSMPIEAEHPEPILKFKYIEKGVEVERSIYPLRFTMDNLNKLWLAAKKYKSIFGYEHNGDFWKFVAYFVNLEDDKPAQAKGLFWVVDDFIGLFFLTDIIPELDASVHFTFFDGGVRRRHPLVMAALDYGFKKYGLKRFSTEVPLYVTSNILKDKNGKPIRDANGKMKQDFNPFKAVENLGFVKEGRKRQMRLYNGKYFDVNMYGLLREDFYARYKDGL